MRDDALGAMDRLLNSAYEIWITAPPKTWLIEIDRYGDARLALPPPRSHADAEAIARRHYAYVGAMVHPFREAGVDVRLFTRDDPAAPDLPRGAIVNNWRQRKRTVGLPLVHGDYVGLAERLRALIGRIAPDLSMVGYDLGYEDSPIVTLPVEDALALPRLLLAPFYADDDYRPVGLMVREFTLFPPDGSWAVRVLADGPRLKVETTAD